MLTQTLRPNKLQDIIGQDMLVNRVNTWFTENKIPNIIYLSGYTGSGKSTFSYIIAMLLQCTDKKTIDGIVTPCLKCAHCKDILTRSFQLDTNFIKGSDNNKDSLVDVSTMIKTQSIYSDKTVFIMDEAQMGSKSSKGALLNLLENGLDDVYIIILSMDEISTDAVMKKALESRMQKLVFRPVKTKIIEDYLLTLLDQFDPEEKIEIETFGKVLIYIARHSEGSLRQAVQDFETVLDSKAYTIELAYEALDYDNEETIMNMYKLLIDKDSKFFTAFKDSEVKVQSFVKYGIKVFTDYVIKDYSNTLDESLLKSGGYFLSRMIDTKALLKWLYEFSSNYSYGDASVYDNKFMYEAFKFIETREAVKSNTVLTQKTVTPEVLNATPVVNKRKLKG